MIPGSASQLGFRRIRVSSSLLPVDVFAHVVIEVMKARDPDCPQRE